MRIMTATEVARGFSHVLDDVEHGEKVIVTRGGERIAEIIPAPRANGKTFRDFVRNWQGRLDDAFAAEVEGIREKSRAWSHLDTDPWAE